MAFVTSKTCTIFPLTVVVTSSVCIHTLDVSTFSNAFVMISIKLSLIGWMEQLHPAIRDPDHCCLLVMKNPPFKLKKDCNPGMRVQSFGVRPTALPHAGIIHLGCKGSEIVSSQPNKSSPSANLSIC